MPRSCLLALAIVVLACLASAGTVIPNALLLCNQPRLPRRVQGPAVSSMRLCMSEDAFSFISPDGNQDPESSPGFIKVSSFDPDRIEEGTWNGYLKEQFELMTGGDSRGLISFEDFYTWKQKKGLVYERDEVHDLWENVLEDRSASCNLEMFIKINFIIDEQ